MISPGCGWYLSMPRLLTHTMSHDLAFSGFKVGYDNRLSTYVHIYIYIHEWVRNSLSLNGLILHWPRPLYHETRYQQEHLILLHTHSTSMHAALHNNTTVYSTWCQPFWKLYKPRLFVRDHALTLQLCQNGDAFVVSLTSLLQELLNMASRAIIIKYSTGQYDCQRRTKLSARRRAGERRICVYNGRRSCWIWWSL